MLLVWGGIYLHDRLLNWHLCQQQIATQRQLDELAQQQADRLTVAYMEGRRLRQENPADAIMGFVIRSAKQFRV
jgi:hypothetical protein